MFFFDLRLGDHPVGLLWLPPTYLLSNLFLYPLSYALVLYGLSQSRFNFFQKLRLVLWPRVVAQLFILSHCSGRNFLYFGYSFGTF